MVDTFDRGYLLTCAAQLFGESWRGAKFEEMTNEELESLITETEASRAFWDQYNKEVAEVSKLSSRVEHTDGTTLRPHEILGFDTADLDGQ
jgi:hypothetical protein